MKEGPILFSAPMVRAILEGRKTQTRRVVGLGNSLINGIGCSRKYWESQRLDFERAWIDHGPSPAGNPGPYLKVPATDEAVHRLYSRRWAGDRMWVRETWNTSENVRPAIVEPYIYGADLNSNGVTRWAARWRPSIHMPRDASRITLEITDVRVERLQDISESDAMDEGVGALVTGARDGNPDQYRTTFRDLWGSINGVKSWAANPWVWATTFERVKP